MTQHSKDFSKQFGANSTLSLLLVTLSLRIKPTSQAIAQWTTAKHYLTTGTIEFN
jgi:hypothetical protein